MRRQPCKDLSRRLSIVHVRAKIAVLQHVEPELFSVEKTAPVLAGMFLVAGLAVLGLPGLSQFVSEILVLIAAFQYEWWVGAIAVTARIAATLCGWCSGASGVSVASCSIVVASTRTGDAKIVPPCTTR